jgi:hypothetical protein
MFEQELLAMTWLLYGQLCPMFMTSSVRSELWCFQVPVRLSSWQLVEGHEGTIVVAGIFWSTLCCGVMQLP